MPVTRVAGIALLANPVAGRFAEDLSPLFDLGTEVGEPLMPQMITQLSVAAASYGKAAVGHQRPFDLASPFRYRRLSWLIARSTSADRTAVISSS